MKAAIYQGDKTFTIEDRPLLEPKQDEVRIDVAYCGICGTDRHIYHGVMDARVNPPQIIGHEMSGIVSRIGVGVQDIAVGDLVVVRPLDTRGEEVSDRGYSHICKNLKCMGVDRGGAMQQSWIVPAFTVHTLPANTDLKLAALTEPLAVACHDVARARLQSEESVVVVGGGPIGLLIAIVAKHKGARVIVLDINEARLNMAKDFGAIAINPKEEEVTKAVYTLTDGVGADVVFEVSGTQEGVKIMTELAALRGRIVMVAIHESPQETNLFQFFWKELEMLGARVYEAHDYEEAIQLINAKTLPLERLITDVVPLYKVQEAFEKLDNNSDSMKVIVDCQNVI